LAPGARSLDVPLGTDTDTISVLAEEDGLALPDAMARQGFEEMQGRRFARWSGSGNIGTLRIAFPNERELPGWVLPLLIAVLAVPLLWATRRAVARPRSETGGRRSESALDPPSADL
jgi:hypothetical protein